MKISFFVCDLARNPIVRAIPLAQAAERLGCEVEILGFLASGEDVFEPYRSLYAYKTIRLKKFRDVFAASTALADMASGDMMYAFKPQWFSYWPALIAGQWGMAKPLLLDIEDNELWVSGFEKGIGFGQTFQCLWKLRWLYFLHIFTYLCRNKTVSSSALKRRYGGTLILHGPNEQVFDPYRSDLRKQACCDRFHLPAEKPLVLFAGTPHEHKGLDVLIAALQKDGLEEVHSVLAGCHDHPSYINAKRLLGDRCHLVGNIQHEEMAALLAAVDIVPLPQRRNRFTEFQIPAKLLEAMSMEKGIVAARVSDLPTILGENSPTPRGWLIEPDDHLQLAATIKTMLVNHVETLQRGRAARAFFLEQASTHANAVKFFRMFGDIMKKNAALSARVSELKHPC